MGKQNDYVGLAEEIVKKVGGRGNIVSVENCMTRLRFVLKDETLAKTEEVKSIKGVQGVVQQGGQYQVIIGTHVKDVVKDVRKAAGIEEGAAGEDMRLVKKDSAFNRFFKTISGCIIPLIPAMIASGVIKGILTVCTTAGVLAATDGTYQILYATADAVLYFLPILVGFNAGKVFGCNQIITAVIGAALVYPDILAVYTAGESVIFLHIPVTLMDYSSTILPIILAAWFASKVEKLANKVIPQVLQLILVPSAVLGITVPVTFLVIGPVMTYVSSVLSAAVMFVFDNVPVLGGVVFGAFWQLFVLLGLHSAFIPVLMNNLFTLGFDPVNAVMGLTVWALAGVSLGYGLKVRDKEKKSMGFGNTVTCLCGVTEPTIYAIALPNFKLFICAMIGGGISGGILAALGGKMYSFVGDGLFRIPAMINPAGIDVSFYGFIACASIAFVVSGVLAFFVADKGERVGAKGRQA